MGALEVSAQRVEARGTKFLEAARGAKLPTRRYDGARLGKVCRGGLHGV